MELYQGCINAVGCGSTLARRLLPTYMDRRWFAAPDNSAGARQLREAMVEALVQEEQREQAHALSSAEYLRKRIEAIHGKSVEIINTLL